MTLLRYIDFIEYSGASSIVSAYDFARAVRRTEATIERTRLGYEFYEQLSKYIVDVTDVYDYSAVYNVDDLVVFNDQSYRALQAVPIDTPPTEDNIALGFWTVQARFDDSVLGQKYNELWGLHLAEYISKLTMISAVTNSTYKLGGRGLGRSLGEDMVAADMTDIQKYKEDIRTDAENIFQNMRAYMQRKKEGFELFNKYYCRTPKRATRPTRTLRNISF